VRAEDASFLLINEGRPGGSARRVRRGVYLQ
jgi:hypothetical protein